MPTLKGKYNIKAVSNMLGIQPSTLRAWERRYHIIAPKRNDAGHRLYTEEHVRILKWLMHKVNEGFTIGQAVQLLESNRLQNHNLVEVAYSTEVFLVDDILQYLLKFDEKHARELLNEAFVIYTTEKVITHIFVKIIDKLETMRRNDEITAVQERYIDSFLCSRIGMIYHNTHTNFILPKALAICAPGELNTLNLFVFTIYLRLKGYQATYFGTGLEEDEIHTVIKQFAPKYVFISCSKERYLKGALNLIKKLQSQNSKICIGLVGFASQFVSDEDKIGLQNVFIGDTKKEWDKWLNTSE
ncbi:MerR family transcriptional regulator [Bacillus pseudomycoides]|uniref:MerR family transcriptional regulator n=1 Tax=Bacillus pseudomycoides TaxID=64104 RepID=A0A2C3VCC0_9BACI|nr:MerR family transcriptional regulator [Bacillus pseudomycoides]PDY45870.1 MerR family transcriptional regulator [Bacillus pseudomycoides]PEA84855.1 MerR family transcriptional regulator [Bacillus pseudomycoides]PEM64494.1 MerR family transcriptional regulator [Bacillus pseudomycoides]PFZ14464.1 MerR family transcriptional regulator [Bacillus pseudomycoides]PGC50968.1 MerR family transcriptional regulator [Bacillus pseudomycoides]